MSRADHPLPNLLIITDPEDPRGPIEPVVRSLAGVRARRVAVQLRAKRVDDRTLFDWATRLRDATRAHNAELWINGRADIAVAVQADGVHLPANGLGVPDTRKLWPTGRLGVSCHSASTLSKAADAGADYALLSPVFDVPCKGRPLGVEGLAKLAATVTLPVFALGGIDPSNATEVAQTGAHGLAIRRAVYKASAPSGVLRTLLEVLDNRRGN